MSTPVRTYYIGLMYMTSDIYKGNVTGTANGIATDNNQPRNEEFIDIPEEIDIDTMDELIEIDRYEYNSAKMELSEEDKEDILRTGNGFLTETERLSKLFAYIRTDREYEFRKVLSEDRSVINTVHNKTYLIHEACRKGASEIVTFLLFSDARCNVKDEFGLMPQHYAVRSNSPNILDILSVFGHDLNVKDNDQNTPLHHAVMLKNSIMIHMLLHYRIDPFAKNNDKKTAIDLAADAETRQVLQSYASQRRK